MDNRSLRKRGAQIAVFIGLLVILFLAYKLAEQQMDFLQTNTEAEINRVQATVTAQANLLTTAEVEAQAVLETAVAAQSFQVTSEAQVNEIVATATAQSLTPLPATGEPQPLEQDQETLAYQLALESELLLNEQPASLERSVLLAIEAVQRHLSAPTIQALRRSLTLLPRHVYEVKQDYYFSHFTYSSDGRYIAAFHLDEELVHIFSARSGDEIAEWQLETFVKDMTFSPDGEYLASVTGINWNENTFIVWEVATGAVIWQHSEDSTISHFSFSPDSTHLGFIAGELAQVWDVETNTKLVELPTNGAGLAFSLNGDNVLTFNNGIYRWDMETGQNEPLFPAEETNASVRAQFSPGNKYLLQTNSRYQHQIWSLSTGEIVPLDSSVALLDKVVFSPNERWLATISTKGYLSGRTYGFDLLQVWDVSSGQEVFRVEDRSFDITFSPNSQYLAVSFGHVVRIWDVGNWQEVSRISYAWTTHDVAFSPDGQLITSGLGWTDPQSVIDMWDLNVPWLHRSFEHQELPRGILAVQYGSDGKHLVTGGESGIVYLWDPQDNAEILRLSHSGDVFAIDLSTDGRYLLSSAVRPQVNTSTVYLWDILQGKEIFTTTHNANVHDVAFSPDGQYFLTTDSLITTTAHVFDTVTGQEIISFPDTGFRGTFFSADGQYLVTASFESVKVWNVESWELVMEVEGDLAALSPDSQFLATAYVYNNIVKVWQMASGQEILNFPKESGVRSLEFSPDGRYLAMATWSSNRGSLQVWDMINQEKVIDTPSGYSVRTVAFSPDGLYIAFGSEAGRDDLVQVWDVTHNREISRWWHPDYISQIAFSPDGKQLLTVSGGTTIHLWQWQSQELIAEACRRLTRNLTQMEWQTYFGDEPYQPTCLGLSGE